MARLFQFVGGLAPESSRMLHGSLHVEVRQERCPACGRNYEHSYSKPSFWYASGTTTPDVVSAGVLTSFVCVRHRVIEGLERHGLAGWTAERVALTNPPHGIDIPELYALGVDNHWGRADLEASGFGDSTFCPVCHKFTSGYRDPQRVVLDQSSFDWESSDFFSFRPFGQATYVTKRVVEIARLERWTNALFRRQESQWLRFDAHHVPPIIDYLSEDWPPPEWDDAE